MTFGCKVNLYETEFLKERLSLSGYEEAMSEEEADIFLINSCTVTAAGDKKVIKTLRSLRSRFPEAVIILTGCLPQAFPEKAAALEGADIITGTKDRKSIPLLLKEFLCTRERRVQIEKHLPKEEFEPMETKGYPDKTRGFLKIQDGCNQFCTYCIIPYSRGRVRSKSIDAIKNEAEALALAGHTELVLTGINLSFYGREKGLRLVDAVKACCETAGIERVRLGSLEPEELTRKDLKELSRLPKLCPQFHLSLQSGCDKTLKAMNRKYNTAEYRELTAELKRLFPDCAITTDVMVGFPDETEEDFKKSAEFVKSIGFSKIHIFPYSQRRGTPAADFPNQITKAEKSRRAKIMAEIAEECRKEFLKSQIGKVFPVLFEKEGNPEFHHGYTPNYTRVKILSENPEKSLRRSILYVKIKGIDGDDCTGELISPVTQ